MTTIKENDILILKPLTGKPLNKPSILILGVLFLIIGLLALAFILPYLDRMDLFDKIQVFSGIIVFIFIGLFVLYKYQFLKTDYYIFMKDGIKLVDFETQEPLFFSSRGEILSISSKVHSRRGRKWIRISIMLRNGTHKIPVTFYGENFEEQLAIEEKIMNYFINQYKIEPTVRCIH